MKKTDLAMLIFIASLSVMLTYGVMAQVPLFKDVDDPVTIKTATPIAPGFSSDLSADEDSQVDTTIFNEDAINPTVKITIGETTPTSSDQED